MKKIATWTAFAFLFPAVATPALADPTETYQREFLFTQDRVVSLTFPGTFITVETKFEQAALQKALRGYDVVKQTDELEGHDAFEVTRGGDVFLYIGGYFATGEISFVLDASRAIDASGVVAGHPITLAFTAAGADCVSGLAYFCLSEHSEAISYFVEWDDACPVDFRESPEQTKLLDCMTIAGFELLGREMEGRFSP